MSQARLIIAVLKGIHDELAARHLLLRERLHAHVEVDEADVLRLENDYRELGDLLFAAEQVARGKELSPEEHKAAVKVLCRILTSDPSLSE